VAYYLVHLSRPLTLVYRRLNQSTYTMCSPPNLSVSPTHCAHHQSKHLHIALTTNQSTYTMCSPPNLSVSPTHCAHHQSKHLHIALTTNQSTYTMCSHQSKPLTQLLTTYLFRDLLLPSLPLLLTLFCVVITDP
jgi:hypothetical protein